MKMEVIRRNILKKTFLLSLHYVQTVSPVFAQSSPFKPIKIIVPLPPGGQADYQARFLAPYLEQALRSRVIVENKAGASSYIGLKEVIQSPSDGKTLLYTIASPIVVSPHVLKDQTINPITELTPLAPTVCNAQVLVAHSNVHVSNVHELITKANSTKFIFRYGSYGFGSSSHLYSKLLAESAGINLIHVPYKGAADALRDLVSGQIELCFISLASAWPYVQAGKLNILGVVGRNRNHRIPEVPTFIEQGIKNLESVGWLGFFGPAKLSSEISLNLNQMIRKILLLKSVANYLEKNGADILNMSQLEFQNYVINDSKKWGELINQNDSMLKLD